MQRREKRLKGRRKDTVVFLDANLPVGMALYLTDLRRYAHWISFDSPPDVSSKYRGGRRGYTKVERRRVRDFFDRTGDINMFDSEGEPPHKLRDDKLFSYIVRMMEEIYPGRSLYLFYTFDKGFFTQDLMLGHEHLSFFSEGKLTYIPLDNPNMKGKRKDVARNIREDFLKRMDDFIV